MWRKSWSKINIFGKDGDGNCSKRKLLPEERSVLDDYLDLAEISPIRGQICIAKDIGYTIEQLSQILVTPKDTLKKAEEKLKQMDIITVDGNRVIRIINWKNYQSEYERQLPYRVTTKRYKKKLQGRDTKNTSVSVSVSNSIFSCIKYLNEKAKRNYDPKNEVNERLVKARLEEGRTEQDLRKVIDKKVAKWLGDPKMRDYLRPSTLFNKTNFENYLNEPDICPKCKGTGKYRSSTGYESKCDCTKV